MPKAAKSTKPANHPAFRYVQSASGVHEYVHKKNGLHVLLWEDHSAPIVALNVTYLVGSRNEAIGYSGATHLLEHLLFKGSKKYNKKNGKSIDTFLVNLGAKLNGTTAGDRTNYYEVVPKEHLGTVLDVEADRMSASFIAEKDRQSEMTVVRNEFEWGENEPSEALDKQIWASAFQAHPYGHYVIGIRSDIENVPIERLQQFYRTFYWPNNAYVTISGDVEIAAALELVDKKFGRLKASPEPIPRMYSEEPRQEGARRTTVRRAGEVGLVNIAHKLPPALSPDAFALECLSGILGTGRTSRMYKGLVDTGLASSVSTGTTLWRDAGLFQTFATVQSGKTHQEIEAAILREYERVKKEGVTDEELEREKYRVELEMNEMRDGPLAVAQVLNETISIGDWTFYVRYLPEIKKLTKADLVRAAEKYLVEDQSITGYFIPKQ